MGHWPWKIRYAWKKDILLDKEKSEEEWDSEFLLQVEKTFKLGLETEKFGGQPENIISLPNAVPADDSQIIPLQDENRMPISDLVSEYLSERRNLLDDGLIKEKTIESYETALNLSVDIIGDKIISDLSHVDARDYRN